MQSIIRAVGRVDPYGSRYLYGDNTGALHLLTITHESGRYPPIAFIFIFEIKLGSRLQY